MSDNVTIREMCNDDLEPAFILPVLMEGHDVLWGDIAAIATLGALPVIVLAFVLQKYLVRGLSFGTVR